MTGEKLLVIIEDIKIPNEILVCYKNLLEKLFHDELILSNEKIEVFLSKFINTIEILDDLQKEIIKLYFGLIDGKAMKYKPLCEFLNIEPKTAYSLLNSSYNILKRKRYLFVKEISPSIQTIIYQRNQKSQQNLCIVDLQSIPLECLAGYEKLVHRLFTRDMIESGTKVILSKLCLTIENLDEIKKEIIKDYYGLLNGKPMSIQEISLILKIDKKLIYTYLPSIHSYLKSHFYNFIKQPKPTLFYLLYQYGVDKRCFRKIKDMSIEDFIKLTEKELHQIFPSPAWFKQVSKAQDAIKANFK